MLASLRLQLAAALEFAACIRLRYSMPDLPRAYKIPLGSFALGAMLSVPIGISLFVCYTTASQSYEALAVIGAGLILGLLLYVPFVRLAPDDRLQLTIEALSRQGSAVAPNPVQGALLKRAATHDPYGHHRGGLATPPSSTPRRSHEDPMEQNLSAAHSNEGSWAANALGDFWHHRRAASEGPSGGGASASAAASAPMPPAERG